MSEDYKREIMDRAITKLAEENGPWYKSPANLTSMGFGALGVGALGYGIKSKGLSGFATSAGEALKQTGPRSMIETSKKIVGNLATLIPFGHAISGSYKGLLERIGSDAKMKKKIMEDIARDAEAAKKNLALEEETIKRAMDYHHAKIEDILRRNPHATIPPSNYTFSANRKYTAKSEAEKIEEAATKLAERKAKAKNEHLHRALDVAIAATLAAGADIGMHKIYDHSHDDEAKKQRFHEYKTRSRPSFPGLKLGDMQKSAGVEGEALKETGRLRTILVEDVLKHGLKGTVYTGVPAAIGYGIGHNVQGGLEKIQKDPNKSDRTVIELANDPQIQKQAALAEIGKKIYSKLDRVLTTVDKEGNIHDLKDYVHGKDGLARAAVKSTAWIVPPAVVTGVLHKNMRRGFEDTSVTNPASKPLKPGTSRVTVETSPQYYDTSAEAVASAKEHIMEKVAMLIAPSYVHHTQGEEDE